MVEGLGGSMGRYSTEIVVDPLKQQTFDFEPLLPKLELTIKAPGIEAADWRYLIEHEDSERTRWRDEREHWLLPKLDGPTVRDCMTPARYKVRVQALDKSGNIRLAALRMIEINADSSVEILLSDDVGSLDVEMVDVPLLARLIYQAPVTVYFKDAAGNFVNPGDSTLASRREFKFRIPSVPAGTYTVIVTAPGFQPFETKDVVISKAATTALKATPELAGALKVTLKDVHFNMKTNIVWVMEDADGKPVTLLLPDGRIATAHFDFDNGGVVELLNLTPAVKQVRIKVEGYKDIVIKTDVKPGQTIEAEATAEKE
jgi:hypothetical protein